MEKVEPDKWYFAVECRKCTRGLAFAEAPDDAEKSYLYEPPGLMKCPHCGHSAEYALSDVVRIQGLYKQ